MAHGPGDPARQPTPARGAVTRRRSVLTSRLPSGRVSCRSPTPRMLRRSGDGVKGRHTTPRVARQIDETPQVGHYQAGPGPALANALANAVGGASHSARSHPVTPRPLTHVPALRGRLDTPPPPRSRRKFLPRPKAPGLPTCPGTRLHARVHACMHAGGGRWRDACMRRACGVHAGYWESTGAGAGPPPPPFAQSLALSRPPGPAPAPPPAAPPPPPSCHVRRRPLTISPAGRWLASSLGAGFRPDCPPAPTPPAANFSEARRGTPHAGTRLGAPRPTAPPALDERAQKAPEREG